MREILGKAKTVSELLNGVKYSIDYYQREYQWKEKQIQELIQDLTGEFQEDYDPSHAREKVAGYGHYFLGSIIVSKKDDASYIVDGQQRLTSLTLLLIFLHNLQQGRTDQVEIRNLIFSTKFGQKSFNLRVPEREPCMDTLFDGASFDATGQSESVQNLVARYQDIQEHFPSELTKDALPYFLDWLTENVHLVEITAYSDDDAYTIFETMNDRGLSLTPTEMLKGFLLANIVDIPKKNQANALWKQRVMDLDAFGKDVEPDFFKAWFRSQYALKIRERKKNARPEDFDRVGTEFHRWVKDTQKDLGLSQSDDFFRFINQDFQFFSRHYLRLMHASEALVPGLEHVLYNAHQGFTLQHMLLLAPLKPGESDAITDQKLQLVARFIDILLTWRLWNYRSIAYSTMQYAMFLVMREIRGLDPKPLAKKLSDTLAKESETFASNDRLALHQMNRKYLHRILARMTDYVGQESGEPARYLDYVVDSGRNRFEVEHIWADKWSRHREEFEHPTDFAEYRNRIGDLLLLPKSFNASYGDLSYEKKMPHYISQNLLARSLHPQCYQHHPGFLQFVQRSQLPFQPHPSFKRAELDARGKLYQELATRIWNPADLLAGVGL